MVSKGPLLVCLVLIVATVGLLAAVVRVAHDKRAAWEAFKVEHHCKITEKMAGDVDDSIGLALDVRHQR